MATTQDTSIWGNRKKNVLGDGPVYGLGDMQRILKRHPHLSPEVVGHIITIELPLVTEQS